jgi:hypothetical protein
MLGDQASMAKIPGECSRNSNTVETKLKTVITIIGYNSLILAI